MRAVPASEAILRGPLLGVFALVVFAVAAAAMPRLLGVGASQAPALEIASARELYFWDRPDGGVDVIDAAGNRRIDMLEPESNGFVRGVLRSLVRDRRSAQVESKIPFRLARLSDGHLVLDDTATGRRIALDAFGPTNAAAFARFLNREGVRR